MLKYDTCYYAIRNKELLAEKNVIGMDFGDSYKVINYNTVMLIDTPSQIKINVAFYSVTTSRLQNVICKIYGVDLLKARKAGDWYIIEKEV